MVLPVALGKSPSRTDLVLLQSPHWAQRPRSGSVRLASPGPSAGSLSAAPGHPPREGLWVASSFPTLQTPEGLPRGLVGSVGGLRIRCHEGMLAGPGRCPVGWQGLWAAQPAFLNSLYSHRPQGTHLPPQSTPRTAERTFSLGLWPPRLLTLCRPMLSSGPVTLTPSLALHRLHPRRSSPALPQCRPPLQSRPRTLGPPGYIGQRPPPA